MRTYRWLRSSGRGLNPQKIRNEPLKRNDDCVDALRYMIYTDRTLEGMVPTAEKRQTNIRSRGVFLQNSGRRFADIWTPGHGIGEPGRN